MRKISVLSENISKGDVILKGKTRLVVSLVEKVVLEGEIFYRFTVSNKADILETSSIVTPKGNMHTILMYSKSSTRDSEYQGKFVLEDEGDYEEWLEELERTGKLRKIISNYSSQT